jgi:hypothetical protein
LRKFLRGCGIAEGFLGGWGSEESKRNFLDRLFAELAKQTKGDLVLARMSKALREQTSFPDLKNWEDSEEKIRAAAQAVEALRRFEERRTEDQTSEAERKAARERHAQKQQAVQRAVSDLGGLKARLEALTGKLGTPEGGYAFQAWFYDLLEFFEMKSRRPYKTGGREIDGSLTHDGTTYLVELKFTQGQADAPDIDTFLQKVNSKADNTMGIFVSISGYSSVAIKEASNPRTPLLLLDSGHVFAALTGMMSMPSIIERVRRHVSQTSEAYLPVSRFSG